MSGSLSVSGFRPGRYAAIDIGTVTCRMLVADVDARGIVHELSRHHEVTNLGEGVDASGVLKPEAMQRVVSTVRCYLDILKTYTLEPCADVTVIAMATSASRDARNAQEFKDLLAQAGLELLVIPGQKEAELSFRGASYSFLNEQLIVVDIGGGSTEIVAGSSGGDLVASHSFNIGCRRVTEKCFTSDPPSLDEIEAARRAVLSEMAPYFQGLAEANFVADRLVAVAGTATTVVSVHEAMEEYDSSRVHRTVVSCSVLDDVYEALRAVSLEERQQIVGLDPARGPVIVAGMVILQCVLELAQTASFTVSESDILHGIILEASKSSLGARIEG